MDKIRKAYIEMLTESVESKSFSDSVKTLESDLLKKHPQLHRLSLYKSGDDVKLDTIIVKKEHRKAGVGSAVLDDIKDFADKHSKRVILTAGVKDSHWGTTSQSRLDAFYRRNGFVANKGRNKDYSISATHYYDGKSHVNESTVHPMIDVDGEMKHRHNNLGQPIHHTDDGIRNFHKWFGDSDSVDESGKPLVVYHGVPALESSQYDHTPLPFNEFTKSNSGLFSFSKSKTFAERYASTKSMDSGMDLSPYVFPVYLKTKTFDPDNKEHIDLLRKFLSETVPHQGKYGWSAWGSEQQIPKEKFLEKLQGIHDVHRPLTKEAHANAVVGKSITLDGSRVYVHHKNETHLFTSAEYQLDNMTKENIDSLKAEAEKEPEKSVQKKIRIFPEHGRNWVFKDRVVSIHPITYLPAKAKGDNWTETENDHLKSVLTNLGFNAIKQTERGQHNIAVFDGNQIKSATHNQGEFDQLKKSIVESADHPMIMLDGEQRHENNSLGQPIHHTYEGISNFHKWFGKSKTVDSIGRPHVFYHGTGSDIKSFSHQYTGKGTDAYGAGFYFTNTPATADTYSLDKESANTVPVYLKVTKPIMYGNDKELTPSHIEKIIRAAPNYKEHIQNFGEKEHVAIRSAVDAYSGSSVLDAMHMLHNDFYSGEHEQFLKTFTKVTGYDGVIVDNGDHRIVNVFHPHQIKSAIGNNGQFKHKHNITENTMTNTWLTMDQTISEVAVAYINMLEDREMDTPSTEIITEEAQEGKKVKLNKPFRTPGGSKKFAVHVKNDQGNVVIVRFGDPDMEIKRDDPERRKSFRARHSCDTASDKTTPRYWSCRFWEAGTSVGDLLD